MAFLSGKVARAVKWCIWAIGSFLVVGMGKPLFPPGREGYLTYIFVSVSVLIIVGYLVEKLLIAFLDRNRKQKKPLA